MTTPVTALAADHAGFELKARLCNLLRRHELPLIDLGVHHADPVDYPDVANALAAAIRNGRATRGVVVCGTGIGISVAANRHPWIRAALCHEVTAARLAREHNDANVLALGARLIDPDIADACVMTFVATPFAGGRHASRVAKLGAQITATEA